MKLAQIFCRLLFLGLFKKGTVLRAQAPLVGAEKEHIPQMGDVTILRLCQYSGWSHKIDAKTEQEIRKGESKCPLPQPIQ